MKTKENILQLMGFYQYDDQLENFSSDFGYDWTNEDLKEAIECARGDIFNVRNFLMHILWLKVVNEYENKGMEREQFDCYINGSLDTHFYFNETEVSSIEDIEELIGEE